MKIRTYLVALAALAFGSTTRADEGMWLLQLMKQQNSIELMKKQGLKLEADDLYNPNGVSLKDAVGIFGGGAFLSVVIGTMTARALECYDFFGKRLFSFMSMLPFLVPGTVFAMGVQITFIKCGLSGTVLGVIIVHLICSLPYAVTLMQDGTRAMGVKLEEQARVLGAGALQAFFKVTLPNLFPVMLSAFSMAFVVSFSQYFLTLMIGGGNVKTFAIVMVPYLGSGERNFASIYSVIFLVIMLLVFGILEWIVGRFTKAQEVEYY